MTLDTFQNIQLFWLLKIVVLIILFFYSIFAFILFNQVGVMNRVIFEAASSRIIRIVSVIHFIFALALLVLAVVIL